MSSALAVLTGPDGFFAAKARDAEEGGPGYLRPALVLYVPVAVYALYRLVTSVT